MTLLDKADTEERTAHTGPPKTGTVIPLTRGLVAQVSPEDFQSLSESKWHVSQSNGGKPYAVTWAGVDPSKPRRASGRLPGIREPMHRQIMKPAKGMVVDHINGDTLDNRRENLRVCTPRENSLNSDVARLGGVQLCKQTRRWFARPTLNGKRTFLGRFDTREEAEVEVSRARQMSGDSKHIFPPRSGTRAGE